MNNGDRTDIFDASDHDSDSLGLDHCETESDLVNCKAVPPLESMALVNVVVQLWKHENFREDITNHLSEFTCGCGSCYRYRPGRFLDISKNVLEMPPLPSLPNLLKEKARIVIAPIGGEMVNWLRQFERCRWHCNSRTERLDTLCFTMQGTIDKTKSLERMLGKVELGDIFDLACEYCLEDLVADLWEQMPQETRESYVCDVFQGYDRHLIAYWTCFMKKELSKWMSKIEPIDIYSRNHSIYRNMFTLSVSKGKALAAKYFWDKLTDGERNNNVVEWTCSAMEKYQSRNEHNNEFSDIVFFLLSQLYDKEQQIQVLHKYGAVVLRSLYLDWPWQKFLLPTIQSVWKYLKTDAFIEVLNDILENMELCRSDGHLFRFFWCNTPRPFRKHFIRYITMIPDSFFDEDEDDDDELYGRNYFTLSALFDIENAEPIKLILNDANVQEKKRIISLAVKSRILYNLIKTENVSLLEVFIAEYLMLECEIKKFKANKMLEYGDELCSHWIKHDNWGAVERMLDWGFDSQDEVDTLKAKIVNRIKADGFLEEIRTFKWSAFESFINWCFDSEEEIDRFKVDLSPYDKMETFISQIIDRNHNIEFPEKFVIWVLSSEKEIVQFKNKLFFSQMGIEMCFHLVDRGVFDKDSHSRSVKLLSEWFHPFEKKVLSILKVNKEQYYCHLVIDEESTDRFFSLLESVIHEGENGLTNESDTGLKSDATVGDSNDESDDCSDTSDDCWSSDQSRVSDESDDQLDLLTGELTNDDFKDLDYNHDKATLLDEMLHEVYGMWTFCSLIWWQIARRVTGFMLNLRSHSG